MQFKICIVVGNHIQTNNETISLNVTLIHIQLEAEDEGVKHPYQEKEPLQPHPGGVNPNTGEIGGPRGPEPTRYGDWERKGRVTDF